MPGWSPTFATSTSRWRRPSPPGLGTRVDVSSTEPVVAPVDLEPSPSLSIVANPPASFEGRKLGVLVTDGSDAKVIAAVTKAAPKAGVVVELVAPVVGGVAASDGTTIAVHHQVDGAPVGAVRRRRRAPERGRCSNACRSTPPPLDFLRDAHAHCKFIGYGIDASRVRCRRPALSRSHRRWLHGARRQAGDGAGIHRAVCGAPILGSRADGEASRDGAVDWLIRSGLARPPSRFTAQDSG